MKQSLYNLSFKNGLIIGGISTILTLVFFFINPVLQFTNFVVPILSAVIIIALIVILAIDTRKKLGGYWNFGQAFLSLFIISVCIVVISLLVNFIILKLNPTLPQTINDAMADSTAQRLEKLGMDQDQIDKTTKMFTDGEFIAKLQPTLLNELKSFGGALVFYVIIDLIIAACIKKTPPLFSTETGNETIE
jgi:glucan phosphoethanolaminetransferase (alkaline phosphatase superfamily)